MTNLINKEHLDNAFTYDEYRQMGKDLLANGKTTGPKQDADYIEYSKLNDRRMDRLDKTVVIGDELVGALKKISKRQHWLVLTELWCGDAAQNVPVLAKMAKLNTKINLCLLLRDENPEIMDAYLTGGGRSIPKLIVLDGQLQEIFTWGPRPEKAQHLMEDWKKNGGTNYATLAEDMQKWYVQDKTESVQSEFLSLLTR